MLGFSKWFIIIIFISIAVGYGTGNWMAAGQILLTYIVLKIVWKFLSR